MLAFKRRWRNVPETSEILGDEDGAQGRRPAFCQRVQNLRLPVIQRELEVVEPSVSGAAGRSSLEDPRRLLPRCCVKIAEIMQRWAAVRRSFRSDE
jgi:hypothetical protein